MVHGAGFRESSRAASQLPGLGFVVWGSKAVGLVYLGGEGWDSEFRVWGLGFRLAQDDD